MKLLEVRNLKLEFLDTIPPTQVTKGISFSMEPGEILGIVGDSGSGKTQTALSILRLLKKQERIASGEPVEGLIPQPGYRYIKEHGLYL